MTTEAHNQETIGFIGAGNMAAALIRGLIRGGTSATQIVITDLDSQKTESLANELGVSQAASAGALVKECSVVVLAVKPGGVLPLLESLSAHRKGRLWLSVCAGVTTESLQGALGGPARIVRAMPNTPALVGEGATGIAAGAHCKDGDVELASNLLGCAGITAVVTEAMMDAVTGVSGSGPAYVMLIIEAMADGAVRAGLPRPQAQELAAQTVLGAAKMVLETGRHPGELKDMVTSPGGTTIAAVAALEKAGLRHALIDAVTAAATRSRELSGK